MKYAMLSNRGDGFKLFVAEGTHAEAVDLIHKKYGESLGLTPSQIANSPRMSNPTTNVKELDSMDFSHVTGEQTVIECN
jgi:hypothetical protein